MGDILPPSNMVIYLCEGAKEVPRKQGETQMLPVDYDFPIDGGTLVAPSLCIPFQTILEVREAAAHTFLTNEELAQVFGVGEMQIGIYLRGEAVQVNLFWDSRRKNAKGRILVTTLKGEETLGRYLCWGDFFQAVRVNGWLHREDFSPLNAPRLPDLHNDCRDFLSGRPVK